VQKNIEPERRTSQQGIRRGTGRSSQAFRINRPDRKGGNMLRPKGMNKGKGWFKVFFVALLAITAAILWIAQPAVATAETLKFDTKGADGKTKKTFEITYDTDLKNVTAKENDQDLGKEKEYPYPAKMKSTNYILKLDPHGPFLITGGNTCVCYPRGGTFYCIGNTCP
jgi:hypothetical protein